MGDIIIRNKKQIYKGDSLLVPDLFDETIEYFCYTIAFNQEKFYIFDPEKNIIVCEELAENGAFFQINDADKRIAFKRKENEKMGVYSYKGELIVPFEYDLIYLKYRRIEVKENYYDRNWELYEVDQ